MMIKLDERQLDKIKEVRVDKRKDAYAEVANILNLDLGSDFKWVQSRTTIIGDNFKVELSTSKDKITNKLKIVRIDVMEYDKTGKILNWDTYNIK